MVSSWKRVVRFEMLVSRCEVCMCCTRAQERGRLAEKSLKRLREADTKSRLLPGTHELDYRGSIGYVRELCG